MPAFGIEYILASMALAFFWSCSRLFSCRLRFSLPGRSRQGQRVFGFYAALETGMLGAFVALDLFLFYVFWEVMLVPMYFLIGVWGGTRPFMRR